MYTRFKMALLCAGALTATSLMTSQAQAGLDGNPFEGLYLGFNANYAKVKSTTTYDLLNAPTSTFNGITSTKSGNGYGGILFGGIGTNFWGPLYAGVEAGLGVNGGTATVSDGAATLGLKAGFTLDLDARLGMTISDRVLVYAIGGYTSIKYKGIGFTSGKSSGLAGYRYGAGFEVGILEDIALRVEYSRTEHSSVTWIQGGDSFTFDPSTQVFRIGLVLHMD